MAQLLGTLAETSVPPAGPQGDTFLPCTPALQPLHREPCSVLLQPNWCSSLNRSAG